MAKYIRHREHHEETTCSRMFGWRSDPNAGFSFTCDAEGNVGELPEAARENYEKCISGEYDVIDQGVVSFIHRWQEPAAIECPCGCEVDLYGFTNTCECGRDFNMSGQELAPREQWGEETGEHWSDIARIP